jgi:hypothetical protein
MQNKAIFRNDKTNPTSFAAKDYENKPPRGDSKKQTQSKPIPLLFSESPLRPWDIRRQVPN